MPPQGLLVIASALPENWDIRFIDENISPAHAARFRLGRCGARQRHAHPGAATSTTSMPARIVRKARSCSAVLPSPPVRNTIPISIICMSANSGTRPTNDRSASMRARAVRTADAISRQTSACRWRISPSPLITSSDSIVTCIGTLQFSSGCPYQCEFCDIPGLYGRQPRFKTAAQISAELDAMCAQTGHPPVVYFVDDNFIGNRKAARDMLPHLIAWQKQHWLSLAFACEATLNIAKQTEILRLMREASFDGRLRRHRDAGGRGAQSHAQGSQQFAADDRRDRDAQRLRPRGERPASFSGSTPTPTTPRRGSRISSSCPTFRC